MIKTNNSHKRQTRGGKMTKNKFDYDLIVIGSGAGGSVAADIVASQKWRVAIVEDDTLGGEAANWGSVPTKALLRSAEVFDLAKNHGTAMGIRSASVGYNYPSVLAWKDLVVKRSGVANSERYYRTKGIGLYRGVAHFINRHQISVNRRHLSAKYFLIATGSKPTDGDVQGLDKTPHLTPRTALDLTRPPKTVFVIGGGATGCEFAQLFSVFGSKVHIADMANRLLPREDREVSELVENSFRQARGMNILTNCKVIRIAKDGIATKVTYLRGSEEHSVKVDQVLLATGKIPAVDLGLENASVEYSALGVETDAFLETTTKGIYAAGDVLGLFMHTHTAVYEGRIVANNLLNPKRKITPNYSAVPRVTYLLPEIASTGMSEADCLKRDLAVKISTAPVNIIARSNIDNIRDGFVKVICNNKGEIIGASVAAPHAGELIHELTLAIQYGLTASEVANTLHAFPTWSEAIRVACGKVTI